MIMIDFVEKWFSFFILTLHYYSVILKFSNCSLVKIMFVPCICGG